MKSFLLTLVFSLLSSIAFAQGVSLETFVDKPNVSIEDELVLTIRIKGATVFTEPQIPNRGNFDVVSRGSSSKIEMVNGNLSALKEYVYILSPKKTGSFTIGPISVFVQGTEYKSGAIPVTVTSGGGSGSSKNPSFPPGRSPPLNSPVNPPDDSNGEYKDLFVTAEVDQKNPYRGEQLIYTFRLFTSRSIGSANLRLPEFQDFVSEEVQKENKYYKDLGGKRYVVSEYRMALFPTKTGSIVIPPATLQVEVEEPVGGSNFFNDPFMNFRGGPMAMRPRSLKTAELKVDVKPLPTPPADFKGLVGSYKLDSTLSKKEVTVGETATLTLTVTGNGNVKEAQVAENFKIPNLKVYDDKPTVDLRKSPSGVSGSKIFKFALVPEAPGQMQIPALTFSYFNPKSGAYEQLSSKAFDLLAIPGSESNKVRKSESNKIQGSEVTPSAEDIATIHPELKNSHEETGSYFIDAMVFLFLLPPFFFLIVFVFLRRKRWMSENSQLVRKQNALSETIQRLKDIQKEKSTLDVPTEVNYLVKKYLGDKVGKVGTALTPAEVKQIFLKKSKESLIGDSFVQFLQELESWQYGGFTKEPGWEDRVCAKAIELIKGAEKELR